MRFIWVAAFALAGAQAWAQAPLEPPIWNSSPEVQGPVCPQGSERACGSWLKFRAAAPWPYQSFVVDYHAGEAVVIISEPPPHLTRSQHLQLVRAVFGADAREIAYARWATGLDGWLEDLVIRVALAGDGGAPAIDGASLSAQSHHPAVLDRLAFLQQAVHGTLDGFYVDRLDNMPAFDRSQKVAEIRVTPEQLNGWLRQKGGAWRPLASNLEGAAPIPWLAVAGAKQPAAFAMDGGKLVAFTAPKSARLEDLRRPFRAFAISSDLLLGAYRGPSGGMTLLARARQTPLTLLPPLRFETLATLARNRNDSLAQSYERQRIFAGKLASGPYASWDWAPIYLSAQLDDTEFGTLLNLADQVLKSWSQAGDVEYFAFPYAKPKTYPFGATTASDHFSAKLGTTTLLFNWNTTNFTRLEPVALAAASSTAKDKAELLTAERTNALPILYGPSGSFAEEVLALETMAPGVLGKDDKAALERQLKADQARQAQVRDSLVAAATQGARNYFAAQGDPLLVRVVQNVVLYQAVQAFLDVSDPQAPPGTARSEAVLATLRAEARAALAAAAAPTAPQPLQDALARVRAATKLDDEALALAIAEPQGLLRGLSAKEGELLALDAERNEFVSAYISRSLTYESKFRSFCASVGGKITQGARPDPKTGKMRQGAWCEYKSTYGYSPYKSELDQWETHLGVLNTRIRELDKQVTARVKTRDSEFAKYEAVSAFGRQVSAFQSPARIADVMAKARAGGAGKASAGSIRTPSLVLSRDEGSFDAVGGHNIDFAPIKAAAASEPALRASRVPPPPRGLFDLALPRDPLGRSPWFSDTYKPPRAEPPPVEAPPPPPQDVVLKAERGATLLDQMRDVAGKPDAAEIAALTSRAEAGGFDTLIRQREDGSIVFVRVQPKPPKSEVFGTLVSVHDLVIGPPRASNVRMEGFSPEFVDVFMKSMDAVTAKPGMQGWAELAGNWLGLRVKPAPASPQPAARGGRTPVEAAPPPSVFESVLRPGKGRQTLAMLDGTVDATALGVAVNPAQALLARANPKDAATRVAYVRPKGSRGKPVAITIDFGAGNPRMEVFAVAPDGLRRPQDVLESAINSSLAGQQPGPLRNVVLDVRDAITSAMKPEEIRFLIEHNANALRVADVERPPGRG